MRRHPCSTKALLLVFLTLPVIRGNWCRWHDHYYLRDIRVGVDQLLIDLCPPDYVIAIASLHSLVPCIARCCLGIRTRVPLDSTGAWPANCQKDWSIHSWWDSLTSNNTWRGWPSCYEAMCIPWWRWKGTNPSLMRTTHFGWLGQSGQVTQCPLGKLSMLRWIRTISARDSPG